MENTNQTEELILPNLSTDFSVPENYTSNFAGTWFTNNLTGERIPKKELIELLTKTTNLCATT